MELKKLLKGWKALLYESADRERLEKLAQLGDKEAAAELNKHKERLNSKPNLTLMKNIANAFEGSKLIPASTSKYATGTDHKVFVPVLDRGSSKTSVQMMYYVTRDEDTASMYSDGETRDDSAIVGARAILTREDTEKLKGIGEIAAPFQPKGFYMSWSDGRLGMRVADITAENSMSEIKKHLKILKFLLTTPNEEILKMKGGLNEDPDRERLSKLAQLGDEEASSALSRSSYRSGALENELSMDKVTRSFPDFNWQRNNPDPALPGELEDKAYFAGYQKEHGAGELELSIYLDARNTYWYNLSHIELKSASGYGSENYGEEWQHEDLAQGGPFLQWEKMVREIHSETT